MAARPRREGILKPEFIFSRTESRRYLEALRTIKQENGILTTDLVVQEAIKEDSPLHDCKCFEWDVRKAAEKYWREGARHLINHFRTQLIPERSNRRIQLIPLFYNIRQQITTLKENGNEELKIINTHEELDSVEANEDFRRQVIDEGFNSFQAVINRYRRWANEFEEMYSAWREMSRRFKNKR
jgi:hypothetical protein